MTASGLLGRAPGLFRAMWLCAALCAAVLPAQAAPLAGVQGAELPALPPGAGTAAEATPLAVVGGTPVVLGPEGAWALNDSRRQWQAVRWAGPMPPDPSGSMAFGDGQRAWLVQANGAVTGLTLARPPPQKASPTASPSAAELTGQTWPALPQPLRGARGAVLGDTLWVAGNGPGLSNGTRDTPGPNDPNAQRAPAPSGEQTTLWQTGAKAPGSTWQALPGPRAAGAPGSLVGQALALYLSLPGATAAAPDRLWRWSADTGWQDEGTVPGQVVSGAARATGQAHVLYLIRPVPAAGAAPGPPRLVTYHTITRAWAEQAALPADSTAASATAATGWHNGLLWQTGSAPGQPATYGHAELKTTQLLLQPLDWLVIGIYLVTMLGIGLHFYLREKRGSTADFFVGGRSIPFWAAGVSLYATNTSSISFIAIPAKAFETNWQYLTNNLVAVVGLVFVATWVVPLLRRLDLMSVFTYLETRFHPAIRMIASALAIVMQIGSRMSVVLFLPALAISTITGLDVVWSVCIMGGITILYTALGGMKAVIWTDFVQVFVMFGGALFAIGYCVLALDGGVAEFVSVAAAEDKTRLLDFSFDLTKATVWGFIFLVLFDVVLTFPKDQVLMQRVLSTKSAKEAGRSIWTFALIMIPGGFMFYLIGTALYVFYKTHPERMNPLLTVDATFPLFIAAELPVGITGLIIAGIFAAAMSTLSSIINSVATMASVDFYERLARNPTPRKSVLFAEVVTVLAGLVGIGAALVLAQFDIRSLFDVSIQLAGLLGGGFAGAYTLGMFTRRANSPGVAIGIGSAIVLTTLAWHFNLMHPYFYLGFSILLCIVIGYIASLFFPAPTRSLKGLTIYADP